jgi:hypothetical protein
MYLGGNSDFFTKSNELCSLGLPGIALLLALQVLISRAMEPGLQNALQGWKIVRQDSELLFVMPFGFNCL